MGHGGGGGWDGDEEAGGGRAGEESWGGDGVRLRRRLWYWLGVRGELDSGLGLQMLDG